MSAMDLNKDGKICFEKTVVGKPEDLPANKENPITCGKVASGCRIAFDLGKSDVKTVAVKDGEVLDSAETEWDVTNPDPSYHYEVIVKAMKATAAKLPGKVLCEKVNKEDAPAAAPEPEAAKAAPQEEVVDPGRFRVAYRGYKAHISVRNALNLTGGGFFDKLDPYAIVRFRGSNSSPGVRSASHGPRGAQTHLGQRCTGIAQTALAVAPWWHLLPRPRHHVACGSRGRGLDWQTLGVAEVDTPLQIIEAGFPVANAW